MAETRREKRWSMARANRARLLAQDAIRARREDDAERRSLTRPDPLADDPQAIADRTEHIRRILRGQ